MAIPSGRRCGSWLHVSADHWLHVDHPPEVQMQAIRRESPRSPTTVGVPNPPTVTHAPDETIPNPLPTKENMQLKRPRIAIPARLGSGSGDARVIVAAKAFNSVVSLVESQDLQPVIIDDPATDMAQFDGLVLPGGGDIDPGRYGQSRSPEVYDVNPAQDALDFNVASGAMTQEIPILGICRGMQILNCLFGGTLHQDLQPTLTAHRIMSSAVVEWSWHRVALRSGSPLALASRTETPLIASAHHQGIDRLGRCLVLEGTAADGLPEAFSTMNGLIRAVQWHPEAEGTEPSVQQAPFRLFADRVKSECEEANSCTGRGALNPVIA